MAKILRFFWILVSDTNFDQIRRVWQAEMLKIQSEPQAWMTPVICQHEIRKDDMCKFPKMFAWYARR
jgi:hypothetical protein